MARIQVVADGVELDSPTLVEGFPGAGLVGKIAADHMVEQLDLTHYANVHCDGVRKVASYDAGSAELASPIRIYADAGGELLVLQSDVPIDPAAATEFAGCFGPWLDDNAVPLIIAGIPTEEPADPPALYGVGSGEGDAVVHDAELDTPPERGVVQGPSGALLAYAIEHDLTAVGLLVETNPRFPDPAGAVRVLEDGVEPIAGVDVSVDVLEDQAEQIRDAKERFAKQMQDAEQASSEAKPIRMFQ